MLAEHDPPSEHPASESEPSPIVLADPSASVQIVQDEQQSGTGPAGFVPVDSSGGSEPGTPEGSPTSQLAADDKPFDNKAFGKKMVAASLGGPSH